MKVLFRFRTEDNELTPAMTADEINNKQYKKFGVKEDNLKNLFYKPTKYLLENTYHIKVELKE